ncbi:ribonucleotide reductase, partial [Pseudomonas urmiensis]
MRLKTAIAAAALFCLPVSGVMADTFWRNVISSGATTASTYLT